MDNDYPAVLPEGRRRMAGWLREGALVQQVSVIHGTEQSAAAFISPFEGAVERPFVRINAA